MSFFDDRSIDRQGRRGLRTLEGQRCACIRHLGASQIGDFTLQIARVPGDGCTVKSSERDKARYEEPMASGGGV